MFNKYFVFIDLKNAYDKIFTLTSPWEGATVFTYPYLNEGAPLQEEAKGVNKFHFSLLAYFSKYYLNLNCFIFKSIFY